MRHQALIDACQSCAELCARCDLLMTNVVSFNDCPHCCRACRAACDLVAALAAVEGLLFVQALRLAIGVCEWCANQCSEQPDADYLQCAESCIRARDHCQRTLEEQVSAMIDHG